jgi:thiol-disulfide isomerase/thioredoxin
VYSKTLAPVYEQLADEYLPLKDKVVIAKVDADAHRDLGKRFGVTGTSLIQIKLMCRIPDAKGFASQDGVDYSGSVGRRPILKITTQGVIWTP